MTVTFMGSFYTHYEDYQFAALTLKMFRCRITKET